MTPIRNRPEPTSANTMYRADAIRARPVDLADSSAQEAMVQISMNT